MNINKENTPLREKLLQKNLFIELPDEVAKQEEVVSFLEKTPKKFVDVNKLYAVLARVVLEDPEGWEPINPDIELLEAGDSKELGRVAIGISRRKFQIQTALKEQVHFEQHDNGFVMTFRGEVIDADHADTFSSVVSQSKVVNESIKAWINWLAETEGMVLAIGSSAQKINPKDFEVISLDIKSEDISEESLGQLSWTILRRLATDTRHMLRLEGEQSGIEVQRDQFVWASNPLISEFRAAARPIVLEYVSKVQAQGVTEFDLVTQVMMHLAIYDAKDVWQGNVELIEEIRNLLLQERAEEAVAKFHTALESGEIQINEDLARYECERQAQKLADHYQSLSVEIDGETVRLPAEYMGDPELNPFLGFGRTEINAKERKYEIDPATGEKVMIVVEKASGKKIIFKSVRPEISYLYSVGFSNLHYPREGEVAVFGAYLEGDELPFAYSSYTPVTRRYSRDMLSYLGSNPDNIMESARAWNCSWSPENTMSVLFSYAHETMKEQRDNEIKDGLANEPLGGVFTSINPNLGFKAVSFRGVRFNVAGMKPTGFSYLRNEEGSADFMPKPEIKRVLGIKSDADLFDHPDYMTNVMPFLPTLELLALFNIEDEKRFLGKPIYRVSDEAFRRN